MANERARALRRNRTSAERKLWWRLRELRAQGYKFRQQAPIDHLVVDLVCLSKRLVVEIDGGTHSTPEQQAADRRREVYLEQQGFRVLRVTNADIYANVDGVMDVILHHLDGEPPPPPSPPRKGEGRNDAAPAVPAEGRRDDSAGGAGRGEG